MAKLCIGLFGTCGNSTWRRDMFIPAYENLGMKEDIDFFNPQVDNWDPSCAQKEAEHLSEDSIILFPITDETYATGSLSETGFSILQALSLDNRRDIVIYVASDLKEELKWEDARAKAENRMLPMAISSLRDRALVTQHLKKLQFSNVYLVDSLEEMLHLSITLYKTQKELFPLQQKYNPHRKSNSK